MPGDTKRILICSTPVGPLGSGIGGGVELTLHSLVLGLSARGHQVEVVAPAGSLHVGAQVHQIPGALQRGSQNEPRHAAITMPPGSVLGEMWEWARAHQHDHDVILNMAYDWLPYHLTPYFDTPVAHLVSMGSITDAMDEVIAATSLIRPESMAVHSRAQAETFPALAGSLRVVGGGIAVERYDVRLTPDEPRRLGFVGRISAEKGFGDVVAVAAATGLPLTVWGLMQDRECWDAALEAHPEADITYQGFVPTDELQGAIGGCTALLMTPKWIEAFGNVAIEAMACGVPVIAYRRGGLAETIADGVTGFLVEPDSIRGMAEAVGRIDEIDRAACRRHIEQGYSIDAFAARVDGWLDEVVTAARTRTVSS